MEGRDSVEAWAFGGNHDEMARQLRLQNTSENATDLFVPGRRWCGIQRNSAQTNPRAAAEV